MTTTQYLLRHTLPPQRLSSYLRYFGTGIFMYRLYTSYFIQILK